MITGRDELQKNADKINSKNLGKHKNIFFLNLYIVKL